MHAPLQQKYILVVPCMAPDILHEGLGHFTPIQHFSAVIIVLLQCVEKLKTGQVNERRLAEQEKVLKKSLDFIDSHFLKDNKYIIGIYL